VIQPSSSPLSELARLQKSPAREDPVDIRAKRWSRTIGISSRETSQ
jgi:hypothetical protein